MLIQFFLLLKNGGVPVTLPELLNLIDVLYRGDLGLMTVDEFRTLARALLVKDTRHYARYERLFEAFRAGLDVRSVEDLLRAKVPPEWLRKAFERLMSTDELALMKKLNFEELMARLKDRLQRQHERHEGGTEWIGTGGTSPTGAYGAAPAGIRMGGEGHRLGRAVKVQDQPDWLVFDDQATLSQRSLRVALRPLRELARTGHALELDVEATVRETLRHDHLTLVEVPERVNSVNVLLFLDSGGSMSPYAQLCQMLFLAATAQFKHIRIYYFRNFVYEGVVAAERGTRGPLHQVRFTDIFRQCNSQWKVIFVGDAEMAPTEITHAGGSRSGNNAEPGEVHFRRVMERWPNLVWLNPVPTEYWGQSVSCGIVQRLLGPARMFPLTLAGLEDAMRMLKQ